MPGPIITRELVLQAIHNVRPAALAILDQPGMTWGPKYGRLVFVVESHTDSRFAIRVADQYGEEPLAWDPTWGDEYTPQDFDHVAEAKRQLAALGNGSTSVLVATRPWLLFPGMNLWAGGVAQDNLSCGFSGAKGEADEKIALLVLDEVKRLVHEEVQRRIAAGDMEL